MKKVAAGLLLLGSLGLTQVAYAQESPQVYLQQAQLEYRARHYWESSRFAFAAAAGGPQVQGEAYALITLNLMKLDLPQAASYFFIRTLQSGQKSAIRKALGETQELLVAVGVDLLKRYLIQHTTFEDYDSLNRSAYLYAIGKDRLLKGQEEKAIGYLNGVSPSSRLWPFVLQLRGAAHAIQGRTDAAVRDFKACAERADQYASDSASRKRKNRVLEAEDLEARCKAGEARTLYQMSQYEEADRAYDEIPKKSFVWPDVLFEQAWAAFGKQEYNKTLGKLVSYKSPSLQFVFNTEVDVLRAQSYLMLCLYDDANDVINEFNTKYTRVGEEVKRLVEANSSNLSVFYDLGKKSLRGPLHTTSQLSRMVNRFVRGPYFQNLARAENDSISELNELKRIVARSRATREVGLDDFLGVVLQWRVRTVRLLGGAFVKNSLMDYHSVLISDFEKMAFIKLEMLSRAKSKLLATKTEDKGRTRGNVEPRRRDDQYRWGFNGEFWMDELGDYVFGLESECDG